MTILSLLLVGLAGQAVADPLEGDCAVQTAYMAALACGADAEGFDDFSSRFGPPATPMGRSMAQMAEAVGELNLQAEGYRLTSAELRSVLEKPGLVVAICHLSASHFVVVEEVTDDSVVYLEPPDVVTVPRVWFENRWTDGNVLLVSGEAIVVPPPSRPWPWRWIVGATLAAAAGTLLWWGLKRTGIVSRG